MVVLTSFKVINCIVLTEIQSHQLFYYMSKSEVSDIFSHCDSHHKKKVILERASYPPVTHRKMNKIQNKQNVAKKKTTWGRHKTRRCITSCC